MSFRASEDNLAASEEFSSYCQPGSVLFSQPAEVDNWCHSVQYLGGYPLTPADTASDCASSDCPDMNSQPWSQFPLADNPWSAGPVPDDTTFVQSSGSEWQPQGVPVTAQDPEALTSSSWLHVSHGPVDTGVSPVLSQRSQNSHSFNSISESDVSLLPSGLDLSFVAEPSWDVPGNVVYSSPEVPQVYSTNGFPYPQDHYHGVPLVPEYPGYYAPYAGVCGPQQPTAYSQGGQAPCLRRVVSDPSAAQQRPLLPRTEGQSVSHLQAPGPGRALQPRATVAGRTESIVSVSTAHGEQSGARTSAHPSHQGLAYEQPRMSPLSQSYLAPRPDTVPSHKASRTDHANEDLSSLSRYDHDEKSSAATLSRTNRYASTYAEANVAVTGQATPEIGPLDPIGPAQQPRASTRPASVSTEGEEGRHRSHPMYNEGPKSDGLYHCPYMGDPNCQHKPTKLKCNYDKFIDSHLKPFRCKIEACAKQEFSSTACLLRHEREAHGMHGHGDRPHLCYYTGCERGISGNGFPRRYNLFDHMKRVHDHKEEPTPSVGNADTSGSRKTGSRKRKATASVGEEPVTQRPKLQPVKVSAPQPSLPLSMVSSGYIPQAPVCAEVGPDRYRQRMIYSQWANQRELLEFQMSAVQSPDDEDNMRRLSQNLEELRRLSQEARQG